MLPNALPIIGAALPLEGVRMHRDWILEKQRDLELQDFFSHEVLDGDWQGVAAAVKQTLDGFHGRLGVHGPFWGFTIASHDPEVRAVVTKRMLQGLAACEAVGATQMVIHSPFTTWDFNHLDHEEGAREALIERTHKTLGSVVKRAEDMGVELVIENIEDKNPADRVALARSFNSDAVRVSLDTGHANYAHGVTGGPPVDQHVTMAGDMLRHVHLQDTDGYADRHWHPGEGNIPWTAVFRALGRLTSQPRLVLEVRHKAELMKGYQHLVALGVAA